MRALVLAAALSLASLSAPAAAAQLVQTSSSVAAVPGGFQSFDPALGILTGVTLQVTTTDQRSGLVGPLRAGTSGPVSIGWNVVGSMAVTVDRFGAAALAPVTLAIAGSGTSNVAGGGIFDFSASGDQTFALDPAYFLVDTSFPFDFHITTADAGLFNGGDTLFTTPAGVNVAALNGACFGGSAGGGDQCNSTRFTLTYFFSAPVPEPASWAMMLTGFAAVGGALRRRTRRALPA